MSIATVFVCVMAATLLCNLLSSIFFDTVDED